MAEAASRRSRQSEQVLSAEAARLADLVAEEDWRRARPMAAMLLKRRPPPPEILVLSAAVALYGAQDPARAERLLDAALDLRPDDRAALKLLHATLQSRGRAAAAQRIARRLVSLPADGEGLRAN